MANQDFSLAGALKVRSAEKEDAAHLQSYCFPEKTKTQVTKDLDADLAEDSQTHRLVAEVGGYPIGQISITRMPLTLKSQSRRPCCVWSFSTLRRG